MATASMGGQGSISFARGIPAPGCLPLEAVAAAARAAVENDGTTVLNYGPVAGYGPLREWIAERHGVGTASVLVTNGSLQGLSLLAGALTPQARRVLVEAPTYDRALHIAARHDAAAVTVRMDADGLDPDALVAELEAGPPAFLYTIPTFQNPTGRTLTLERRRRIAELAREGRVLVVEDDPYALVRFDGEPLPTIYELAGGENVVHSFSFSKIVAPGLRVGYLVGPPELIARLEALAVQTYLAPSFLSQATVLELIRAGALEPSIAHIVRELSARRDAMVAALDEELPDVRRSDPQGGYFLWLDFPDGVDTEALLARAEAAGVTFVKGSDFYPRGEGGRSSARLAYSFVSPAEIATGVARLRAAVAETAPRVAAV